VILFVDLKLKSLMIHAEKQNPESRYRVIAFFICLKPLQMNLKSSFQIKNPFPGKGFVSFAIPAGLPPVLLTKLRFENQKAAKSKKQACHSLMTRITSGAPDKAPL
jgi:hypothetical protein